MSQRRAPVTSSSSGSGGGRSRRRCPDRVASRCGDTAAATPTCRRPSRWSAACSPSSAAPATGSPTARRRLSRRPTPRACSRPSSPCPAGTHEYKVALNGTWDENYGAGGGAANIPLAARRATSSFASSTTTPRTS